VAAGLQLNLNKIIVIVDYRQQQRASNIVQYSRTLLCPGITIWKWGYPIPYGDPRFHMGSLMKRLPISI
jgi:hypothetical protein